MPWPTVLAALRRASEIEAKGFSVADSSVLLVNHSPEEISRLSKFFLDPL
jgi:hypothetical protein